MTKSNFLLVDLNEAKTKKLAETITSDTSRKILNHLAEKEHDTEAKVAETLQLPISTVHYHLQKLLEAKLIKVEEFHYSPKGREVNHYKLANKYIIIAPGHISGLREKLKGILPVGIIALGIAGIIKLVQSFTFRTAALAESAKVMAASVPRETVAAAEFALDAYPAPLAQSSVDIALWFAIGSAVTVLLYIFISWVREKWGK